MGTPTSGLIAEFFLQNLENIHLAHLSDKHKIAGYFCYIDDILLIYDSSHTDIHNFNTIHPNLKFTAETETDNKLRYLDITIHRTPAGWKTSVYTKPTFMDMIIPYSSNHPAQYKYTAIRFLYNRLNIYNLHEDKHHPQHYVQQCLPDPPAQPPPPSKTNHHSKHTNDYNTKMGYIYLHR
jgi:hypothetical protein